jgi:penicillin-binding protein 2
MALAGLTYGKRTPSQAISDPGYFSFGNHTFRDDKVGGHGMVDMYKSIVVSCDTYYYQLANDLTIDGIARFMGQLGFGSRSGIDLSGEAEGVLPSQEWKRKRFRKPEQQKWYAGETISIGIGQGYNSYTPLQLANATATLANNGVMYRPHIVNYVEEVHTRERAYIEPKPLRDLNLKPEHIAVVKNAMVGVNREGTGARAFAGATYTNAGKTGTAQVVAMKEKYIESRVTERFRDHALFIAYAPADKPTIALAVIVENSGFGARAAAPIARQVFDYWLLGKEPAKPAKEEDDEPAP